MNKNKLSSQGRKEGEVCRWARVLPSVLKPILWGRVRSEEGEERRTDMNGAIFLFILQGDDGHGKSVSKVISPSETERF